MNKIFRSRSFRISKFVEFLQQDPNFQAFHKKRKEGLADDIYLYTCYAPKDFAKPNKIRIKDNGGR